MVRYIPNECRIVERQNTEFRRQEEQGKRQEVQVKKTYHPFSVASESSVAMGQFEKTKPI